MNNYRRKPTRGQTRQAIDGILNAPANRINQAPDTKHSQGLSHHMSNSVRSSRQTRRLGDFKGLSEGYHSADQTKTGRLSGHKSEQHHITNSTEIRKSLATQTNEPAKLTRKQRRQQKKAKKKQRRGARKWVPRIIILLIIIVVAVAGFLLAKGYIKLHNIFQGGGYSAALGDDSNPSNLYKEGDGRVNILLIGGRADNDPDGGGLTDTILVLSIDPITNKSAFISVPRDLWVRTDGRGSERINAVFKFARQDAEKKGLSEAQANAAGAKALKAKMTEVLGIDMHYYAMVDIEGFTRAVDTLGGVDINVPDAVRDASMAWQNNGRALLVPEGLQTLTSKQALFYVQSRKGDPRSDFGRSERQRLFLAAMAKEITKASTYGNPLTVSRLMDDFGNHVRTDFAAGDVVHLYNVATKLGEPESIGLTTENLLMSANIGGRSVLTPKAGTFDYSEIHAYIRSALPDGYIVRENAPVVVLNGTTVAGKAQEVADILKSYAYNVTKVDNASTQDYNKTIIIDLTGKNPYTKNYLEKRFSVTATSDIPEGLVVPEEERQGFIIIIGGDAR